MRAETEGGKTRGPAPKSADPQIVARDLVKTYRLGGSVIGALQGVSVEVARGEYLAVTGASGSGKSTFMNLIGALDTPTSGSLQIEGREMGGLSSDQLALYRNEKIGFVFQNFNLLARTSALDNVALPLLYSHHGHKHARDRAKACLAKVGLAHREDHRDAGHVQLLEQGDDLLGGVAVQRAGRLIGKDDMGIVDQRAGDGHPLLLAATHLIGAVVRAIRESDGVEGR